MSTCQLFSLDYHPDPAHYFQRLHAQQGAVLLDCGQPVSQRGRFDILSAWPLVQISPTPEELVAGFRQRCQALVQTLSLCNAPDGIDLPFTGGLLGYLTYDFNTLAPATHIEGLASATVGLYDWAVINDHQQQL